MKSLHFVGFLASLAAATEPAIQNSRPPVERRKFTSQAVENVITAFQAKTGPSDDVKTMFANCYASTLDTTVAFFDKVKDQDQKRTFVVTGDIPAMWLRDSMNQVLHYIDIMGQDKNLQDLILGVIAMQADFLSLYPWGNAYKPPVEANIPNQDNSWALHDFVQPAPDLSRVWECKYELDSLASFMRLSAKVAEAGNFDFLKNPTWKTAMTAALQVMTEMSEDSYSTFANPPFVFRRTADAPTETVQNSGQGPIACKTGMVRSHFRPSDDATTFPFLVPANAMASAALTSLGSLIADKAGFEDIATQCTTMGQNIKTGIEKFAKGKPRKINGDPTDSDVYAFEVDGCGGMLFMDDANVPSLLALPDLGYIVDDDQKTTYAATREWIWSAANPYFSRLGDATDGIGSPHTGMGRLWPMSHALYGVTADDVDVKKQYLDLLTQETAGTGMMHESILAGNPSDYTRQWFAWANLVYAQLARQAYPDSA